MVGEIWGSGTTSEPRLTVNWSCPLDHYFRRTNGCVLRAHLIVWPWDLGAMVRGVVVDMVHAAVVGMVHRHFG
jgi:hypothetical protein